MFLFLIAAATLSAALLWVFRRTSRPERIRAARRRVSAALLEMRLFGDEPGIVLRAFLGLWLANASWLKAVAVPSVAAGALFSLSYLPLDATYGVGPLLPGSSYLVTAQLDNNIETPRLIAPPGFLVDSLPVRDRKANQVSWRLTVNQPASGELELVTASGQVTKSVDATSGWHPRFPRRILLPPTAGLRWVDVAYPPTELDMFGLRFHWLIWISIVFLVAAITLKGPFRVVF